MNIIYQIRGAIGRFIKTFEPIILGIIKFGACFLLFRYVSGLEACPGTGLANSMLVRLVLSAICMFLPARCAVFLAMGLGLYNMYQVTLLGAAVAACFFMVVYVMASRLFPDHAWLIALVPLCLHYKLFALLPLIAGMYMGAVAVIPLILGLVLNILMGLIPEFLKLSMPSKLDQLPSLLSEVAKTCINQLMHNETLVFLTIVFTVVVILVALLRTMRMDYGNYISLLAGGVLAIICLIMGRSAFHFQASTGTIIGKSILTIMILAFAEFMHAALNYQGAQRLNFEDDEYKYYVTVIPKIYIGKKKKEVKQITGEQSIDLGRPDMPVPAAPAPASPAAPQTNAPQSPVSQETRAVPHVGAQASRGQASRQQASGMQAAAKSVSVQQAEDQATDFKPTDHQPTDSRPAGRSQQYEAGIPNLASHVNTTSSPVSQETRAVPRVSSENAPKEAAPANTAAAETPSRKTPSYTASRRSERTGTDSSRSYTPRSSYSSRTSQPAASRPESKRYDKEDLLKSFFEEDDK